MLNYIVIEGNIGAGKTSLAMKLAGEMNARLILEKFEDNPFLPKFYKEPEKYSFPLELSFLAERYRQHKEELTGRDMFAPLAIADYHLAKSLIFAGITLAEDEYKLFKQLFNIIYTNLPMPDLFIYLHTGLEKLLENIKQRGREYETAIEPEYLKNLQNGYFNFMKSQTDMKILILDIGNVDFINNDVDFIKIKNVIFKEEHTLGLNWHYF